MIVYIVSLAAALCVITHPPTQRAAARETILYTMYNYLIFIAAAVFTCIHSG